MDQEVSMGSQMASLIRDSASQARRGTRSAAADGMPVRQRFSEDDEYRLRPALPFSLPIQRLAVGAVNDPLESEADAIAARVMGEAGGGSASAHAVPPALQRKCGCAGSGAAGTCAACRDDEAQGALRRKATRAVAHSEAPAIVHDVLSASGRPLDTATRAFMEPRFGFDFGRVRVHTGPRAAESAKAIDARAYTVNHSIIFGADSYAPHSAEGRRLLAHELAHVVQQGAVDPVGSRGPAASDSPTSSSAAIIRRVPTTPQTRSESRAANLDLPDKGSVAVTRKFHDCPCSEVPYSSAGVFYNPDLKTLAIAYKHCHGETTFETYARTATDFSGGGAPTGDARIGVDVNVWGKNVQGRLIVEGVGQNQSSGPGVGGHAKLTFQGGKWQVRLEPTFIRQLGTLAPGSTPNHLDVNLGAKYGSFSVELDAKDVLSATREFSGAFCLGADQRVCVGVDVQERPGQSPNVTPEVVIKGSFGEGAKKERCSQCYCPAPAKQFTCTEHHHEDAVEPGTMPQERTPEYRYYFAFDATTPSEEDYLRGASAANIEKLKTDLAKPGYQITSISGFASPEGRERQINDPLALARAGKMAEMVRGMLTTDKGSTPANLPKPAIGRSELLGRAPAAPSAHLRDAIAASGLHSAEEVTPLLTGKEIPTARLTPEFLDLFKRTTSDEWMQLFGLVSADPSRPQVEEAVNAFIASNGQGPRPWERVFRLLRYGVVRLHGTDQVPDPKRPGKAATDKDQEVTGADCKAYGKTAEDQNLLGPIDSSALQPIARDANQDESCWGLTPAQDDIKAGCDYNVPEALKKKGGLSAPDYAPHRLGGQ
jgi:hypothetical protein